MGEGGGGESSVNWYKVPARQEEKVLPFYYTEGD